jgi:hypothetical protein
MGRPAADCSPTLLDAIDARVNIVPVEVVADVQAVSVVDDEVSTERVSAWKEVAQVFTKWL